jgi:hypothetical protein
MHERIAMDIEEARMRSIIDNSPVESQAVVHLCALHIYISRTNFSE